MSFSVWVTGPDRSRVEAVGDEIARRLVARHLPVEVLDSRTPGIEAIAGEGVEHRAAFVATTLARHGIATVIALPVATCAARHEARTAIGRMIEVYVPSPAGAVGAPYEAPDRPEVEVGEERGGDVERVLHTLEVLDLLPRAGGRGYTEEEEREVIRRLKAFGYL